MNKHPRSFRALLLGVFILAGLTKANAENDALSEKWRKTHADFRLTSRDHTFCVRDENQAVTGSGAYKKVTLASVSKLITSLWAIEELGPEYKYETRFYLSGKKLHIAGSLDPVFSKRKLFYLLSQLNNHGITELEEITFDKNVRVYTRAERYVGYVLEVSPARTAANLRDFWHTPEWNKLVPAYQAFINETPDRLLKDLQIILDFENLEMKVGKVSLVSKNPLPEEGLVHFSPAMEKYLKFMNIVSNNYFADQIFDKLGGEKGFDQYYARIAPELFERDALKEDEARVGFDDGEPSVKMFTGSGLDTKRKGSRVDNFGHCAAITAMIQRLDNLLTEAGTVIQKVVAVPGTDLGTFRSRLKSPRLNRTFVAKTGTLYHTSALAGILRTEKGSQTFGIFHQLTGWKGSAKMVQNKMVEVLWEHFGGGKKFSYQPEFFFPADTTMAPL